MGYLFQHPAHTLTLPEIWHNTKWVGEDGWLGWKGMEKDDEGWPDTHGNPVYGLAIGE